MQPVAVAAWLVLGLLLCTVTDASDNGRALTPPLGWRSWNQYQARINQATMEASFRALAQPRKGGVALADLGYTVSRRPPSSASASALSLIHISEPTRPY